MSNKQMTADQMIEAMKNMDNGDRIDFLHYLSKNHFHTGKPIDDYIDRELSEEETTVMKLAYDSGYNVGVKVGMEKVFKGGE